MSDHKKSVLPKLELIIIGVFILSFLIWSVSKCSRSRSAFQQEELVEEQDQETRRVDSLAQVQALQDSLEQVRRQREARRKKSSYVPLYVTMDDLNVRNAPDLNGDIIDQLPLFEEVEFLNEWTDFTTEVNLGKGMANEPWIKIRTPKGHEGWVYGAGVHYYKMKHPLAY